MRRHELKCWPDWFHAMRTGAKPFDVRLNDREFKVGDIVRYTCWDPVAGRALEGEKWPAFECRVIYVLHLHDVPGLAHLARGARDGKDYVVLGIAEKYALDRLERARTAVGVEGPVDLRTMR